MTDITTHIDRPAVQPHSIDGERMTRLLFIVPAVVYLLLLSVFPFIYSVYLSLYDVKLTQMHRKWFVGLENYQTLLTDTLFLKAVQNTVVLTTVSIGLELALGFLCAKVFLSLREMRAGQVLRSMTILPMMITPICVGLMFSYILNPTLGIANYLLGGIGIEGPSWFGDPAFALPAVIAINAWQWTPFMMLLMLAGLVSIPDSLYEAAELEGAKWHHVARWIELPAIRDVILVGVILRVIDNLKLFDLVYVTTRGGPGDATELITFFAYRQDFRFFQVGYGSAASVIILLMSIVVTTIAVTYLRRVQK
ncbi:carbohydrate ABC transporter permease [Roseibium sp.]|uniref:carbohydrate ABC transporter permease n=1 Tax=Roseibium sp. TaxID=1936156 RepID=UPI003D10BF1C